jgi:hypothetical protein
MSTEIKSDPEQTEPAEASPQADSAEAPASSNEGQETPPEPRFNWEYRTEFRINQQMREVVGLTKKVVEGEIDRLRRKVEKLTYGS